MKEATLVVALGLLVSVALANVLPEPCELGRDGRCVTSQDQPSGNYNPAFDNAAQAKTPANDQSVDDPQDQPDNQSNNQPDNNQPDNKQTNQTDPIPKHSHSTAGEEEKKRQMVEFPMWGRFLCAGIGAFVFLFYLGVGIPCNACGSLDKLRHLKGLITGSKNKDPAEEEAKKPMNPTSETSQVQIVS